MGLAGKDRYYLFIYHPHLEDEIRQSKERLVSCDVL